MTTTPLTDRGHVLRVQALGLLQQAASIDGLKPFAITHHHEYGASTYFVWAESAPTQSEATLALSADFEPNRGDHLHVETDFSLEEVCGVAAAARLPSIAEASPACDAGHLHVMSPAGAAAAIQPAASSGA